MGEKMRVPLLTACLLLSAVALQAQTTYSHKERKLNWVPAPAVFPSGAKMAVIKGDPSKASLFTIELALPDGYKIPPHFHPTDEAVTVKQGVFLVGMGDTLDLAKTNEMKPGDQGVLPAGHHHYAAAQGATLVSVTAKGPFAMTYVKAANNPEAVARK
jgi:quercetin dioxygenase-like cupin family protein